MGLNLFCKSLTGPTHDNLNTCINNNNTGIYKGRPQSFESAFHEGPLKGGKKEAGWPPAKRLLAPLAIWNLVLDWKRKRAGPVNGMAPLPRRNLD